MVYSDNLSDAQVQQTFGRRLTQARLALSWTQAMLAKRAGVSKRTVERLEAGENTQWHNVLRVLRALGLLGNLAALVPDEGARPMDLLRLKKPRQRASSPRKAADEVAEAGPKWSWGDEEDDT